MTIAIVCGGRRHAPFTPAQCAWLDALHAQYQFTLMLDGGATGADTHGRHWAQARGIDTLTCWGNWVGHGRSAGPRRNLRMLEHLRLRWTTTREHGLVVSFPGGTGTAHMVLSARLAGIQVQEWDTEQAGL